MIKKLCLVLFLLCGCAGKYIPGEQTILSPPYSLLRILQHEAAWRAFQRNRLIVNSPHFEARITNNNHAKASDEAKYNPQNHNVMSTHALPEVHNNLPERSSKISTGRQTLDFRVHSEDHGTPEKAIPGSLLSPITSGRKGFRNSTKRINRKPLPGSVVNQMGVLPDDVCDRCPVDATGKSTLLPCTCVGNTGTSAGLISITCPDTIISIEQLQGILTGTEYFTTHVSRFTLHNSQLDKVITDSVWGDLDFHQILLDNNHIEYVDKDAFYKSADTLHYLSLKNNSVKQYITGPTNDLPYLETLDLSYNEQIYIFSDAFSYKALKYLDLSNNMINSLGQDCFADLDSLTELNLSNNQLTKLDEEAFKFNNHCQTPDLLLIDLSNNNISQISDAAFAGVHFVQIDLQNNLLPKVREEVFNHVLVDSNYFAEIILMGNPVVCDCDVFWIVSNTQVQSCFDNFMCTNLGKSIDDVEPEDLGNCTEIDYDERQVVLCDLQHEVPIG